MEPTSPSTDQFAVPAPEAPPAEVPVKELQRRVQIQVPTRHNRTLQAILERVNADDDLYAIWRCANVNAVDRLGIDRSIASHAIDQHTPGIPSQACNFFKIGVRGDPLLHALLHVAVHRAAAENLRGERAVEGVEVVAQGGAREGRPAVVARQGHDPVAQPVELEAAPKAEVMISEILHAIITHRTDGRPLTLEAGVVRVADALDMAKGRSRIPFEAGLVNIHSVSAAAIDRVVIGPSDSRPIKVSVHLNNSAGIFQLDGLLKEKLDGSGLENYVEIIATIAGEAEKSLITEVRLTP